MKITEENVKATYTAINKSDVCDEYKDFAREIVQGLTGEKPDKCIRMSNCKKGSVMVVASETASYPGGLVFIPCDSLKIYGDEVNALTLGLKGTPGNHYTMTNYKVRKPTRAELETFIDGIPTQ